MGYQHQRCDFRKIFKVTKPQLKWFIESINNLIWGSENKFFLRNGKEERGTTNLRKLRAHSEWVLRCVVQPTSDYQSMFTFSQAKISRAASISKNAKKVSHETKLLGMAFLHYSDKKQGHS